MLLSGKTTFWVVRHDGQHPRLEKIAVEYLANE